MGILDWFRKSDTPKEVEAAAIAVQAVQRAELKHGEYKAYLKRREQEDRILRILMDDIAKIETFEAYLQAKKDAWGWQDRSQFKANFRKPIERSIPLCQLALKNDWVKYRFSGVRTINELDRTEKVMPTSSTTIRLASVQALKIIIVRVYNEILGDEKKTGATLASSTPPHSKTSTPLPHTPTPVSSSRPATVSSYPTTLSVLQVEILQSNLRQLDEYIARADVFRRNMNHLANIRTALRDFRREVLYSLISFNVDLATALSRNKINISINFDEVQVLRDTTNTRLGTFTFPDVEAPFAREPFLINFIEIQTNAVLKTLREERRVLESALAVAAHSRSTTRAA